MPAAKTKDPNRLTVAAVRRILESKMPMSAHLKMRVVNNKGKVRVVELSALYDGDGIYYRVVDSTAKKESIFLHRSLTAAVKKFNA